MAGTFALTLIEPQPMKAVCKVTSKPTTIGINCTLNDGDVVTAIDQNGSTASYEASATSTATFPLRFAPANPTGYVFLTMPGRKSIISTSNCSLVWNSL